jgi:hypothetical protein
MSSSDGGGPWLDKYWPLLVIGFGLIFIGTLALFHPHL